MNAEEARKKATSILVSRINSQYNNVKGCIEDNVNEGKLLLIYDYDICDEVKTKLEVEGFVLTHFQSGMNEWSYEIKW